MTNSKALRDAAQAVLETMGPFHTRDWQYGADRPGRAWRVTRIGAELEAVPAIGRVGEGRLQIRVAIVRLDHAVLTCAWGATDEQADSFLAMVVGSLTSLGLTTHPGTGARRWP